MHAESAWLYLADVGGSLVRVSTAGEATVEQAVDNVRVLPAATAG